MNAEKLEKIGLSHKEALVYIKLLEAGNLTAGSLAKLTGIKRPTVYLTLKDLIALGLVAEIAGKNKKFRAESPEKLNKINKKRRRELINAELELEQLIPSLLSITKISVQQPEIKVLYGIEGVKNIIEDISASRQSWYFFGSAENLIKGFSPADLEELMQETDKHRERADRPKTYFITDKGIKDLDTFKTHKPNIREIKILPNVIKQKSALIIYEDKVVIFSISENTFATVIESKEVMGMVKVMFSMLWESIKD